MKEYGIPILDWDELPVADGLIVAGEHKEYINLGIDLLYIANPAACVIDVKSVLDPEIVASKGYLFWRL